MIETIEGLLRYIYPRTPSPDILTRESDKPRIAHIREPHTMAAIAQAQRINRDSDYDCSGLCEFHIGIIYIHWRDFSGAGQQFALARRQWRFVNRQTAVCLTHFVEGYTLESNFAYEVALLIYKRAEQCLLGLPQSDFANALQREITDGKERVRQQLSVLSDNSSPPPAPQPTPDDPQIQPTSPPISHVHHQEKPAMELVEMPISNIHQAGSQEETASPQENDDIPIPRINMRQIDSQVDTPPPQDNMHEQEGDDAI